jgi:hypothetical protein
LVLLGLFGAVFGALIAGIAGGLALGTIGFLGAAQKTRFPTKSVLGPILLGMAIGSIAAFASFCILIEIIAQTQKTPFSDVFNEKAGYLILGTPPLMLCGLVAGAVKGQRQIKKHTEPEA